MAEIEKGEQPIIMNEKRHILDWIYKKGEKSYTKCTMYNQRGIRDIERTAK